MIRARFRLLIGTTMALALIAGQADKVWAQPETKEVKKAQQEVQMQPAARIDVEFSGGKLIDYVETIRRCRPKGTVNIVVMPEAKELEVPPITLVSVTVKAAFQLLQGPHTMPDGRSVNSSVDAYPIGGSTDMVYKVGLLFGAERRNASSVWSLTELFDGQSESEVLGAIDVVQSLYPDKAEIKFHQATKLLIARGTKEQLDLVQQVIEQLIKSAVHKQDRIRALRSNIEDIVDKQNEYLTKLIEMDNKLKQSKLAVEEEGSDDPDDRMDMLGLTGEVKRAQAQYDMVDGQLKRINERLKKAQDTLTRLTEPS